MLIAQIFLFIIEKFMSLNGMTLFELSRGRPKTIKVCHAIMYDNYYVLFQKSILGALPFFFA